MKIRNLLVVYIVFIVSLAAGITVMTTTLYDNLLGVEEAQERRFTSYRLAEELRQSSDDLTRFARTYVATGDERFARHFRQVLNIRKGMLPRPEGYGGVYWDLVIMGVLPEPASEGGETSSLEERMLKAGLTPEEFSKLRQSQLQSDELVGLEEVSMHAVRGQFDDDTGSFSVIGPPDRQMAIELLHGERYHQAKAAIMQPVGEFLTMIDQRTQRELDLYNAHAQTLLLVILATSALLVLGTLAMMLVLRNRLMRPGMALMGTVERISEGDLAARTGIVGRDEVALLAGATDTMAERLAAALHEARRRTEEAVQQSAALENMDQGVAMYDGEHRLLACNRRFREYLEMPEAFLSGKLTFADYLRYLGKRGEFGDADVEEVVQQRLSLLVKPHTFERRRPDGSILEVQRHPVSSGGFISIYTEVTDRKRAEMRLREDEARFRAIDSTAPVALVIVDRSQYHIQHVNPQFCELLGTSAEAARNRSFQSFLPELADRTALADILDAGEAGSEELRFRHSDGREKWVTISVAPLEYRGEAALIAGLSDITERKRMEAEPTARFVRAFRNSWTAK